MAGVSASQAIGFIVGPGELMMDRSHPSCYLSITSLALGLVFVPLKAEGWSISAIKFHLNIYTGPGYLGGLLGVINIVLLIFLFWERKLPTATTKDKAMKKVLKCK